MNASEATNPAVPRYGRRVRTDMILRALLAVVFAAAAIPKLIDAPSSAHMFAQIGAGHWLQYFVGTAELLGAVGLLVPSIAAIAGAGLCLDMVGATVINADVLHSNAFILTAVLAAVLAVITRRRWTTAKELPALIRKTLPAAGRWCTGCLRQPSRPARHDLAKNPSEVSI